MKVLMIGWEFPPYVSGGLGTHCYYLAKHLAGKVDLTILVPKAGIKIPGVEIVEVGESAATPYSGGKTFSTKDVDEYNSKCVEVGKKIFVERGFDVIHCHDWLTVKAGKALKEVTGKPLVFMVHATEYDRGGNLGVNERILRIEQEGINSSDMVITNSQRMKMQLVERFNAPEWKVEVVYNAVDTKRFKQFIKKCSDEKIVLYLARLTLQKGPEFFLKAAEKVLQEEPNAKFVVAGTGHLLPELIRYTIEHNLTDKVIFTGYVPDEKLTELYSISDVYVLPSVSEPFGITVLEAMASGTPVIVSKESGVIELVEHCLKVDFWDVDDMANKIISVLRYKPLKKCLSKNGGIEVEKYTWEDAARETVSVYQKALGGLR